MSNPLRVEMSGPLSAVAPRFLEELLRQGYRPETAAKQLQLMAHLSRWLAARELDGKDLSAAYVEHFLAERRECHHHFVSPKGIGPLLGYLRRLGVVPAAGPTVPRTPSELVVDRYSAADREVARQTSGADRAPAAGAAAGRAGGPLDPSCEVPPLDLTTGPHVQTAGKGRRQRATPLTAKTVAVLRTWLQDRQGPSDGPVFATSRGTPLSRDAVALLLTKYTDVASCDCSTLNSKTVSPHVLRHTAAMNLLHAGVDSTVIALWLGHESVEATQIYIYADMTIKERALARAATPNTRPGRYRPPDALLAFLEDL